jgi:hypothetical protein
MQIMERPVLRLRQAVSIMAHYVKLLRGRFSWRAFCFLGRWLFDICFTVKSEVLKQLAMCRRGEDKKHDRKMAEGLAARKGKKDRGYAANTIIDMISFATYLGFLPW